MAIASGSDPPDGGSGVLPRPKVVRIDRPSALNIIGCDRISDPMPPPIWLVPGLRISAGAPTLFAGYGYSGKSVAIQGLCISVASGVELWGKYAVRRGRVLHLDYEQGARITLTRYQRLALSLGVRLEELEELEVGVLPSCSLDVTEDLLVRVGEGRAMVCVDSWRAAFPRCDENSSEVRKTFDRMTAASERTGCTFIVLHHSRKPQKDGGGVKFSIRGSSGFFDGCQTVYVFDGEKVGRPRVMLEKDRIGGQELPALDLAIEDAENGGLNVQAILDGPKPEETPDRRFQGILEAVLGMLDLYPQGMSGNELAERMGARKQAVLAALQSLVGSGVLCKTGEGSSTRYVKVPKVRNEVPF